MNEGKLKSPKEVIADSEEEFKMKKSGGIRFSP